MLASRRNDGRGGNDGELPALARSPWERGADAAMTDGIWNWSEVS